MQLGLLERVDKSDPTRKYFLRLVCLNARPLILLLKMGALIKAVELKVIEDKPAGR
jgi:hypothetical protein